MYIHQYTCISPQQKDENVNLEHIVPSQDGKYLAQEPVLQGVPPGMVRRMSKSVRIGIGAGLPLIKDNKPNGIIIGTANGGMEDCIKFLNQIIDFEEGLLTPGSFVQGTPNAIAGQLSLITKNQNYNATHVHNGLSFENALLDAFMLIKDNPQTSYLLGGVDEISSYNYNIETLGGWYDTRLTNENLYMAQLPATIAGEGATMFMVSGVPNNAVARVSAIEFFHATDATYVQQRVADFLKQHDVALNETIFISGENGDVRALPFYEHCEAILDTSIPIIRFKHIVGEYPTAIAYGLWLACHMLQTQQPLPTHFYKRKGTDIPIKNFLLYNQYHGKQHSLMLVTG